MALLIQTNLLNVLLKTTKLIFTFSVPRSKNRSTLINFQLTRIRETKNQYSLLNFCLFANILPRISLSQSSIQLKDDMFKVIAVFLAVFELQNK